MSFATTRGRSLTLASVVSLLGLLGLLLIVVGIPVPTMGG